MTDRLPILEDLGDVRGKRVLVRLDLNVPLGVDAEGTRVVTDDFRIRAALPTLTWLLNHGARVTACTHLGRPAGAPDPRYDVEPVRELLAAMIPGVQLLENLRFSPGEKGNDPAFVAELIEDQDLFVNDAFGVCHRSDASVVGPPKFLPSAAGRLVQREVEQLGGLLDNPARPFVVIIGGAKVADKLGLLRDTCQPGRQPAHRGRHGVHLHPGSRRGHGRIPCRRIESRRVQGNAERARQHRAPCRLRGGSARRRADSATVGKVSRKP